MAVLFYVSCAYSRVSHLPSSLFTHPTITCIFNRPAVLFCTLLLLCRPLSLLHLPVISLLVLFLNLPCIPEEIFGGNAVESKIRWNVCKETAISGVNA